MSTADQRRRMESGANRQSRSRKNYLFLWSVKFDTVAFPYIIPGVPGIYDICHPKNMTFVTIHTGKKAYTDCGLF